MRDLRKEEICPGNGNFHLLWKYNGLVWIVLSTELRLVVMNWKAVHLTWLYNFHSEVKLPRYRCSVRKALDYLELQFSWVSKKRGKMFNKSRDFCRWIILIMKHRSWTWKLTWKMKLVIDHEKKKLWINLARLRRKGEGRDLKLEFCRCSIINDVSTEGTSIVMHKSWKARDIFQWRHGQIAWNQV